jgi:hypothetical protein
MGDSKRPLIRICRHGYPSDVCSYCYLDPRSGEALHVEGKNAAEVGSLLSQLGRAAPVPTPSTALADKSAESESFFLWRTPWRRAGTILVGLAGVAGAVAAILALIIK